MNMYMSQFNEFKVQIKFKGIQSKTGTILILYTFVCYRTTKENVISLIKYLDFQLETPISLLDLGALTYMFGVQQISFRLLVLLLAAVGA